MSRKNKITLRHSVYRPGRALVYLALAGLLFASGEWWNIINPAMAAGTVVTVTTQGDFESGTVGTDLDSSSVAGQLTLSKTVATDTTKEQLMLGRTPLADAFSLTSITENSGGEVAINQGKTYTTETSPAILSDWVYDSFIDETTNYLYVCTYAGISVIDLSNDTLVRTYTTETSPAIINNSVNHAFIDSATNRLYASTWGGLSVIDLTSSTLVKSYSTESSPALPHNTVRHSFIDTENNYLYVSSYGGLTILDLTDDTVVKTYNKNSSPAVSDNNVVWYSYLATSTNYLYASAHGGLYVLDLNTDTLVKRYYAGSSPQVVSSYLFHSLLDPSTNRLYISTSMGLSVIDLTNSTTVKSYTVTTSPAVASNHIQSTYLDAANNRLYVATQRGVSVLDLTTDTLAAIYVNSSSPRIFNDGDYIQDIFLDGNNLYISGAGLTVINLDDSYNEQGIYVSNPQLISATATKAISWEAVASSGQAVVVKTRTGSNDDFWIDNFDDDSAAEFVGDYYEFGASFTRAEESEGTLKIYDPEPYDYSEGNQDAYFWLDTGEEEEYFPPGSIVRAKLRINSDRVLRFTDYIFEEWWWSSSSMLANNTWIYPSFIAGYGFSRIGFNVGWLADTWDNETDSVEIDWLSVEAPDSSWSDWSEAYTDASGALITSDLSGQDWIQYRAELTTGNTASTPFVESVSLYSYATSGTYISAVVDMGVARDSGSFTATALTPSGTGISYAFRSGATATPDDTWSGWQVITDTLPAYARYAQVKAVLTTDDQSVTPILYDFTLIGGDVPGIVLPSVVYSSPSAPVAGFQMKINDGAPTTTNRQVTLTLSGGADAAKMALSMNEDFNGAVQEEYMPTKLWDLCSRASGALTDASCLPGVYTVYARFYTAWGVASPIISQSISLTANQSSVASPATLDSDETPQIISPFPSVDLSPPASNGPYTPSAAPFTAHLRFMSRGDEVRRLQMFLNQSLDTQLADDGPGSPGQETSFFGPLTRRAVIKFQEKYAQDILAPWGLKEGTGFVGKTTIAKINELLGI